MSDMRKFFELAGVDPDTNSKAKQLVENDFDSWLERSNKPNMGKSREDFLNSYTGKLRSLMDTYNIETPPSYMQLDDAMYKQIMRNPNIVEKDEKYVVVKALTNPPTFQVFVVVNPKQENEEVSTPLYLTVNLKLTPEQVGQLAENFNVDSSEIYDALTRFTEELSTVEGLELTWDALDYFNY